MSLFDSNNPYESIIHFTNQGHLLLTEQKQEFFSSLESFFAESAYKNHSLSLATQLLQRFGFYDIPNLMRIAREINLEEKEARLCQLAANISKVASLTQPFNDVYEVVVVNEATDPPFWGWIAKNIYQINSLAGCKKASCFYK